MIAKRFGVTFERKKLISDPAYNAQMGAAELGELLRELSRLLHPDLRGLQCRRAAA